MAERRPPGFNVNLGFYDCEEVLSIPKKVRASAIGVWTLCGAYSAAKLSDGWVPAEKLRELGCTPAIRAALTNTKPEPLWVDDAHVDGIWFTRWEKWQRTCGEVKAYRAADAERKRLAREAKRARAASANAETSARTPDGPSSPVRADSSTPKTETETETESLKRLGPRKRGTRLTSDWKPSEQTINTMRAECPGIDLKAEHRKFIDYWTAKPGKDGIKLDWDATWRNWIRSARAPNNNGSQRPHKMRTLAELAAAELANESTKGIAQ